jgi:hypothetical protein
LSNLRYSPTPCQGYQRMLGRINAVGKAPVILQRCFSDYPLCLSRGTVHCDSRSSSLHRRPSVSGGGGEVVHEQRLIRDGLPAKIVIGGAHSLSTLGLLGPVILSCIVITHSQLCVCFLNLSHSVGIARTSPCTRSGSCALSIQSPQHDYPRNISLCGMPLQGLQAIRCRIAVV